MADDNTTTATIKSRDMHIYKLSSKSYPRLQKVCDEKKKRENVLTVEDGALSCSCFHCQMQNNCGVLDSCRWIITGGRGLEEGCKRLQLQIRSAVKRGDVYCATYKQKRGIHTD